MAVKDIIRNIDKGSSKLKLDEKQAIFSRPPLLVFTGLSSKTRDEIKEPGLPTIPQTENMAPLSNTATLTRTSDYPEVIPPLIPPCSLKRPVSASATSTRYNSVASVSRREERYMRDQRALASAATPTLPEFSPDQLQRFELARALDLLSSRIQSTRQRLQELCVMLGGIDHEPEAKKALQCERWMEERWLAAAEEEYRRLEGATDTLQSASAHTSASIPSKTRRQANLASFFARSPTLVSSRTSRTIPVIVLSTRTMTVLDAEPPRLRSWPIGHVLRRNAAPGLRRRSMDSKGSTVSVASVLGHGSARRKRIHSSLQIATDPPNDALSIQSWVHSAPAYTTFSTPGLSTQSLDDNIQGRVDVHHHNLHRRETFSTLSKPIGRREGSAVIYPLGNTPRPYEEILAERKLDLNVTMPDYVATLLDEFDSISDAQASLLSPGYPTSPSIVLARPSMDSVVVVARPSVDSYHYNTLRLPRSRSATRISSSLHHSLRISRSFEESDHAAADTRAREQSCPRRRSFLRRKEGSESNQRPQPMSVPAPLADNSDGMLSRVRRRVSTLGRR